MDELIAAGEAQPLLPEFDIGPVWYERMWWAIPHGEGESSGYLVAQDEQQVELTAMFLALQRSAEVVTEISEQRARQEQAQHGDDPGLAYEGRAGRPRRWWRR